MPPEETLFIERLRDNPSEGLRLIYADWLDEQGHSARAEFIRIQCALQQTDLAPEVRTSLEQRETQLREANEAIWASGFAGKVEGWAFHGGLIDRVSVPTEAFLQHGDALLTLAPIRRVRLLSVRKHLKALVRCAALQHVRELDLSQTDIGDDGYALLASSSYLHQLERLELGFANLTDRGLIAIARSPALHGLQHLALNENPHLTANGMRALVNAEHWPTLRTLDLSDNDFPPDVLRIIYAHDPFPELTACALHGNRLGNLGTSELAESAFLQRLLHAAPVLDLRHNEIGAAGLQQLVTQPHFAAVEVLLLDNNPIGNDGLRALADVWHNDCLRVLSLQNTDINDEGCHQLTRSPLLASLRVLDLTDNFITDKMQERLHEAARQFDWRGLLELKVSSSIQPRQTRHATPEAFIRRRRG